MRPERPSVLDAAFQRDPCPDLTGRPGQRRGDPCRQPFLLLRRQPAGAAFVAKTRQALDPILLIQLMPGPDRVVVQIQDLRHRLTAHAVVQ